jgi:hypothetical protein
MPRTLLTPLNTPFKAGLLAAALALAALWHSGCQMTPDYAMSVTSADGVKLQVPFNGPPVPVTDGVVTVNAIQFAPWELDANNKAKTLAFSFLIGFKPGAVPERILIEDDTESPILQLFEDDHAKIVKNNLWAGVSKPFAPSDEHVNWVLDLDNNVRVYRVTVTLKDGTTHVLYKPVLIPAAMKQFMRSRLEST